MSNLQVVYGCAYEAMLRQTQPPPPTGVRIGPGNARVAVIYCATRDDSDTLARLISALVPADERRQAGHVLGADRVALRCPRA